VSTSEGSTIADSHGCFAVALANMGIPSGIPSPSSCSSSKPWRVDLPCFLAVCPFLPLAASRAASSRSATAANSAAAKPSNASGSASAPST
jgi:hypothetical protein